MKNEGGRQELTHMGRQLCGAASHPTLYHRQQHGGEGEGRGGCCKAASVYSGLRLTVDRLLHSSSPCPRGVCLSAQTGALSMRSSVSEAAARGGRGSLDVGPGAQWLVALPLGTMK